jgi:ankyrin repeat protein
MLGNALQAASVRGHEHIVKLLIESGADVSAQDGEGGNALQDALDGGYERIVKLLLDSGADVNTQGGRYGNMLQAASARGHERIVKLLLDRGTDVNAHGGSYGNALTAAAAGGHERIVKLLLDKGANVNCLGGWYGSFLNILAFQGYTHLLRLVYEQYHAIRNLVDSHGRTALQLAARNGHIDTFKYLISLGLDPETEDAKGDRLLHYASSGSSLQVLNVVLEESPTSSPQSGHWTPLHWACRTGNPDVVERLIKEGLRSECVTLRQPEGQWSPISIAIFHGNGKILEGLSASCRSLLSAGADLSAANTVQFSGKRHGGYWCNGCFHVST